MNKKFFGIILATAILSSSAFFLFPQFSVLSDQMALAISFAILIPQAVAMWLFLTSLKAFRKGLRIAYSILAVGVFIFGLVQLQLPLESLATLDPTLSAWLTVIPALLGAAIIYLGVWKFAGLLEVKTIWAHWVFAIALAAIMALLSSLIPHADAGLDEIIFDAIFGTYIAAGVFSFASGVLALRIRQKISATYKAAIGWLSAALFVAAFACLHETIIRTVEFFSTFDTYFVYGYSLWAFLVAALLFLKASLSFRATSVQLAEMPDNASLLDIITYMAQKASQPAAIDVVLDKVRQITSSHQTKSAITEADKAVLFTVYQQIETYLITKEPLRHYTQESLRAELPDDFRQVLATQKK